MEREIVIRIGLSSPLTVPFTVIHLKDVEEALEEDIRKAIGEHMCIDDIYEDIEIEINEVE